MQVGIGKVAILAMMCISGVAQAGFKMEADPVPAPVAPKVEKAGGPVKVETFTVAPQSDTKATPPASAVPAGAAPAPVAKAPPPPPKEKWEVSSSDVTLRNTLVKWGRKANPKWQVAWEVPKEHPVQLEATFEGDFPAAVEQYIAALRKSELPLMACLYEGNHVVRVVRFGDIKDCAND